MKEGQKIEFKCGTCGKKSVYYYVAVLPPVITCSSCTFEYWYNKGFQDDEESLS